MACTSGWVARMIGRVRRRISTVQARMMSLMRLWMLCCSRTERWKCHRIQQRVVEGRQSLMDVAGQLGACSARAPLELPLPCSRQCFLAPGWDR